MTAASVLARGRAAAEALMVDQVTIRRRTGETTDPDTGQIIPTYTTAYTGKCRVQTRGAWGVRTDLGEAGVVKLQLELQLPVVASVGVAINDEVTMDSATHDPDLVDRTAVVPWTVRDIPAKTHATARRVMVEQVAG